MASPHYSTPYSQLTYPTYTPLSVLPAKTHGTPGWSGMSGDHNPRCLSPGNSSSNDIRLLRAAVRQDVALLQHERPRTGTGWPSPAVCVAPRSSHAARPVAHPAASTRTNAPVYAPPPITAAAAVHVDSASTIRDSNMEGVRSFYPAAAATAGGRGPSRPARSAAAVVGDTEVDVQSDVVRPSEAAPYLCAFQEECQSLLALLNGAAPATSMARSPSATPSALPEALPPAPQPWAPVTPAPPVISPQPNTTATTAAYKHYSDVASVALRPAPASVPSPLPQPCSPPLAPLGLAAPQVSTTYAQLMHEMDALTALLHRDSESASDGLGGSAEPSVAAVQPAAPRDAESPSSARETPEKQARPSSAAAGRLPGSAARGASASSSRVTPGVTEPAASAAASGAFWAGQAFKWMIFVIEKKLRTLQQIEGFEDTRAPTRRGATVHRRVDSSGAVAVESAPVRVASGVLRLLRSLDPASGEAAGWTAAQQRHACTRVANLLAELTSLEEAVTANLLNDAAAGATMEREGLPSAPSGGGGASVPGALALSSGPAGAAAKGDAAGPPVGYRKDMLETLALLEKMSQENNALKAKVADGHTQIGRLRDEVQRERAAKNEVAEHFDRIAAQNGDLTEQLRAAKKELLSMAVRVEVPAPEDAVLRSQLEQQTQLVRELRSEADKSKRESDMLRRTVMQLRDAVVRHRAVIDLLTRHRRERQQGGDSASRASGSRQGTPRLQSPPMQLIDDILCGIVDAPPTTESSLTSSEDQSSLENTTRDVSEGRSSDYYRM